MQDFIEFSFNLPFGDLVFEAWDAHVPVSDGKELVAIAHFLGIEIDPMTILADYEDTPLNSGEVFFYFSLTKPGAFLCLDFYHAPTDQCGLMKLGVRCPATEEHAMLAIIRSLHRKGTPRTALCMDWSNQALFSIVQDPDYYLKGRKVHFLPFNIFDAKTA